MKNFKLFLAIACIFLGTLVFLKPQPVIAAEKVSFSLPVLGKFALKVEDLAIFANEGKITPQLAYYARFIDKETLQNFRQVLQTNFGVDPVTVYRLTNMSMGEDFLTRLGNLVYTHPEQNGMYAIRSALILSAAEPEGLNVINFLRHFPTKEIQLNTNLIFALFEEAESFFKYKDATVEAIALQAEAEIKSQPITNLEQLPDLRQSGQYQVNQRAISFPIRDIRQTPGGFAGTYELEADVYTPQKLEGAAPLVVIAHGLGSERSDFTYLARHLASHGYIVAVLEHSGSSGKYKEAYLDGEVGVDVSPLEFYSRPRDITHLLDSLEQHPDFQKSINWSQVAAIGHSFGGTTTLLAAGAPINLNRINSFCQQDSFTLNVSVILQCRADDLPPGSYNLQDSRIKAVVALSPVTSSIFGPESLSKVEVPVLMLGGTMDFIAPFIEEQAHPFLWLTTPNKYLATIVKGSHFSTINEANIAGINDFLRGFNADLSRDYLKALSLGFLNTHIKNNSQSQPYLTAAYAKNISDDKLPLHLIQSLTPEQLELAYGDTPPKAPIPQPIVKNTLQPRRNTLEEISATGKLKVALRTDAAPFGYIDNNGDWMGYCLDFADKLGDRLTKQLNKNIEVITVPSSLANRFELVQQSKVNLECGPNSIVDNPQKIVFSDPFFSSGTRFLVNESNSNVRPDSKLEDIKLGVLAQTTTESFLKQKYPDAQIIVIKGENGRTEGIKAVNNGTLDAMVSDTVLLTGEIDRQRLNSQNYQTIPEKPLTCDYYGLILPQNDPQWRTIVNNSIRDRATRLVFDRWLGNYYDRAIADLDYCQNRQK